MQAGDQPFELTRGTWTEQDDSISVGLPDGGSLLRTIAVGDFRISIGLDVVMEIGAGQHQIGLGASPAAGPSYFVELNEGPGYNQAAIVFNNGGNYQTLALQTLSPQFHPGRVFLQATQIASTRTVTMDGGWGGEPYNLTAPAPSYTGGTDVLLFLHGITAEVRYAWIVGW